MRRSFKKDRTYLESTINITYRDGAVTSRKDFAAFGDEVISAQRVSGPTGNGYSVPDIRKDYTGYEKDIESGLEFAQARYYNTQHGRFTSVDPLTASASIRNPQTFNRYTYVLNSPYKFTDPLGLLPSYGSDGSCAAENDACLEGSYEPYVPPKEVPESKTPEAASPPAVNETTGPPEVPSAQETTIEVVIEPTVSESYEVSGNDANEAIQDAKKNGEKAGCGAPHQGCVKWNYSANNSIAYSTTATPPTKGKPSVGTATTTGGTITAKMTMVLPKWSGYDNASPEQKQNWDTYLADLKSHEDGHVAIVINGAKEIAKAIPKDTTATGATIKAALSAVDSKMQGLIRSSISSSSAAVSDRIK